MEECSGPLDHHAELGVAVCAVELPVIVLVDQKWPVDQRPIVDAGLEEIRERTLWERWANPRPSVGLAQDVQLR